MAITLTKPDAGTKDWTADVNQNFTDIEAAVNANTARTGYHDRGDFAAHDFTQATLTTDGAWHPLNLAAIIPENCRAVNVRLILVDGLANQAGEIMTFGSTNALNTLLVATQVPNIGIGFAQFIKPNADRKLLYRFSNTVFTIIWLDIIGWIL